MNELANLDENTQRRILLQAAKACSPYMFEELRKEPKTLAELEKSIGDAFWGSVLLFWTVLIPLLCIPAMLSERRLRRYVHENWQKLLAQQDAECNHLAVVGDILSILKRLPKSYKPQTETIKRELQRANERWLDLQSRLGQIQQERTAHSQGALETRCQELAARIAAETDEATRTSLQGQLEAIQGQQNTLKDLKQWQERLQAAQEECAQGLIHLRSRLSLLTASGGVREATEMTEAATSLQTLNTHLKSTQDALEEVMQMSVR